MCPNHLAQQWADEIKKYTSLNAILYTTLEDIKNLTYADLASACTNHKNTFADVYQI